MIFDSLDDLRTLAVSIEAHAEGYGWDQEPMLFTIDTDGGISMYVLAGHPAELLPKVAPEPNVVAAALMTEAWSYPDWLLRQYDSLESLQTLKERQPPSEHPQRVECRQVLAMTADKHVIVSRNRGEEAKTEQDVAYLGGRLPNMLRRFVTA